MNCTAVKIIYFKTICLPVITVVFFLTGSRCFAQTKPGRLTGTIRDENNQAIAGVSVAAENQNKGTSTSVSGDYVLTLLPGTYTIIISSAEYETQKISEVTVKGSEETHLSITLVRAKKSLRAVVVTSTARRESAKGLLQAQKNNSSMTDGISAEQITRLPVTNIAQVLTKVSGVNIQNDKFVTVRGVSDRYNNALINGSTLPSTEPNRRNFSFDIVPSSLVDNVVVNKTATPDLPGEFTGGIVQINTKDVPTKNFLELTLGTGINTESFDKGYYSFKRDKYARLGIIDQERKWYGDGRVIDPVKFYKDFSSNDTAAMRTSGSQIPNRWQRYRYGYVPMLTYQLSGGLNKRFENSRSLGVVAALTYQSEELYEEGESASIGIFAGENTRTRYVTSTGALVNTAYKTSKHKLAWKNLLNRRYTLQSDEAVAQNFNFGSQVRFSDVVFSGTLFQTRLEGEHLLTSKKIKIDWFADYVSYDREQPDSRYVNSRIDTLYNVPTPWFNFKDLPLVWGGLYSSVLKETRRNTGVNLSFPFVVLEEKQLLKVGYSFSNREADYDGAGFRIRQDDSNPFGSEHRGLPYYEIATQENIRSGNLFYFPSYVRNSTTGDQYTGVQKLHSTYFMADVRFLKRLRLIGGVRNENNNANVNTVYVFLIPNDPWFLKADSTVKYRENDWLPSLNAIYSLNEKMNLRAAFSKTLARPDFFERSPFLYFDFPEQLEVSGDKALEITRVKNYDLRYEFYPTPGEIVSASVFYKDFDKPVERFFLLGNPTNSVQYKNLYAATAVGFEVDLRKSLEFINPHSSIFKNLMASGNFTYIQGELTGAVTRKSPASIVDDTFYIATKRRPIQNLSPYLLNLGLNYQEANWGLNVAFNRTGRKIVNGGIESAIVQYENPRNLLDAQLHAIFSRQKLELRLNASNILNSPYIIYSNNEKNSPDSNQDPKGHAYNEQFDFIAYRVYKGVSLSIKAVYRF